MKLLHFLDTQLQNKLVGTLALGEKFAFQEIFFEKDHVYLCDDVYSGKVDFTSLEKEDVLGDSVTPAVVEEIVASRELKTEILPRVLFDRGLIDKPALRTLASSHIRAEILELLWRSTDSFHFQAGRVPEKLLQTSGLAPRTPVPLVSIATELRQQSETLREVGIVLPSREETFVFTEQGLAYKQSAEGPYSTRRLLGLIDGFRTLGSLLEVSRMFEYEALRLLYESLEKQHLKKVHVPELKGISARELSSDQLTRYFPLFERAVKYSVNQLAARENLAFAYQETGDAEKAAAQFTLAGDSFSRMGKIAKAVESYQRSLSLVPGDTTVIDRVVRIYKSAAEQEVARGKIERAVSFLEKAVFARPEDLSVFRRLAEVLASAGKIRGISELCDRIVAHARKYDLPAVAIGAWEAVLTVLPDHPVFLKKLANLHLDLGNPSAAVEILGRLAQTYVSSGRSKQALELFDKIQRIGKVSPELQRLQRTLEQRYRPLSGRRLRKTRVGILSAVLIATFTGYQIWSYTEWRETHSACVAYAESSERPEHDGGSSDVVLALRPSGEELRHEFARGQCRAFIERFPISVLRFRAHSVEQRYRARAEELAEGRREAKRALLADAALLAAEGQRDGVMEKIRPLLQLPESDSWRAQAESLQRRIETYETSARELVEAGRRLEQEGEFRQAYRVYRRLLKEFPRSTTVRDLELPVLVDSVPARALGQRAVREGTPEPLGVTPFVVYLKPTESVELELSAPGHRSLEVTLTDGDGAFNLFVLERRKLSSYDAKSPIVSAPAIDGRFALCGTNAGRLLLLNLESGQPAWIVERGNLKRVIGTPLVVAKAIYTVWNDKEIWAIERVASPGEEPRITRRMKLENLATTAAVAVAGQHLAVGTINGAVHVLRQGSLDTVRVLQVGGAPSSLTTLGPRALLVTTKEGELVAHDVLGDPLWRRKFDPAPARPPFRAAERVVVLFESGEAMFLRASTGEFIEGTQLEGAQLAPGADARLLVMSPTGSLRAVTPDDGKVVTERTLSLDADAVVPLDDSVVLLHGDRKELLVLDAATLAPRWGTRLGTPILHVAASAKHVVVATDDARITVYSNQAE